MEIEFRNLLHLKSRDTTSDHVDPERKHRGDVLSDNLERQWAWRPRCPVSGEGGNSRVLRALGAERLMWGLRTNSAMEMAPQLWV